MWVWKGNTKVVLLSHIYTFTTIINRLCCKIARKCGSSLHSMLLVVLLKLKWCACVCRKVFGLIRLGRSDGRNREKWVYQFWLRRFQLLLMLSHRLFLSFTPISENYHMEYNYIDGIPYHEWVRIMPKLKR